MTNPNQLCDVLFLCVLTAQMAMHQHVVEHGEHDKAQKKLWSPTASGLSSRCPDTVLPLDPARSE